MNLSPAITVPSAVFEAISIRPLDVRASAVELLFESQVITLALVNLKSGRRLYLPDSRACLLTAMQGQVRLQGPNGSLILNEHGCWRLEDVQHWKIRAMADASILLMMVKFVR